MSVNPKHAEEYELPELNEGGASDPIDAEQDRLLRRSGSQDKLERNLDGDERDDRPLLASGEFEDTELVGKGTKIDDLIARVCISYMISQEHRTHR